MLQRIQSFVNRVYGILNRRFFWSKVYLAHSGLRKLIRVVNTQHPEMQTSLLLVGARRGLERRYNSLLKLNHFSVDGIEPDKKEVEAILAREVYRKMHAVAVADEICTKPLYITKVLGCTSIHKPKMEKLQRYTISGWFETQAQTEIPVTTLDALYNPPEKFDFISMDVQGAEYEVIKGGERLFDQAIGITLEAHFLEVYEGQKLFSFIHDLCLSKGFRLIRLDCGEFDGEIAESECFYVRDYQLLKKKEDLLKCMLFALNWNNKAYVENLLRNVSAEFFPPAEKKQILGILKMKEKEKSPLILDGFSAAAHSDGSGYF